MYVHDLTSMRKKYDLVLGLGMACSCSETLRRAGLQLLSFPYDWITIATEAPSDYVGDVTARVSEIVGGFANWLDPRTLTLALKDSQSGKDIYHDSRRNLVFNHDFIAGVPFADAHAQVAAKYQRRIDRLLALLASAKRVLIVRIDRPDLPVCTETSDALKALDILAAAYPAADFDFLQLSYEEGRPLKDMIVSREGDHFTRWTFDYKDHRPGVESHRIHVPEVGEYLAKRFAVRDYRTGVEKRAHNAARRKARYSRVGATSLWGYHWARFKTKFSRIFAIIHG